MYWKSIKTRLLWSFSVRAESEAAGSTAGLELETGEEQTLLQAAGMGQSQKVGGPALHYGFIIA